MYISNTNCTIFTTLTTINVSITFPTHVVTSAFKCNNLLTGSTKTHNCKTLFEERQRSIAVISQISSILHYFAKYFQLFTFIDN